jgi:hypothetical protein
VHELPHREGLPSMGRCTARACHIERSIRLLTNSRRSQSEKQWASRGRETAARKPHKNKVPGPHH